MSQTNDDEEVSVTTGDYLDDLKARAKRRRSERAEDIGALTKSVFVRHWSLVPFKPNELEINIRQDRHRKGCSRLEVIAVREVDFAGQVEADSIYYCRRCALPPDLIIEDIECRFDVASGVLTIWAPRRTTEEPVSPPPRQGLRLPITLIELNEPPTTWAIQDDTLSSTTTF